MDIWKARLLSEIDRAISNVAAEIAVKDEQAIDNSVQEIRETIDKYYKPVSIVNYDACWSEIRQVVTKVASLSSSSPPQATTTTEESKTRLELEKELKDAQDYVAKVRVQRRKDRETINLWKAKIVSYKRKVSSIKRVLDNNTQNNNAVKHEVDTLPLAQNEFPASLDLDESLPPSSSPSRYYYHEQETTPRIKSEDSQQALEIASMTTSQSPSSMNRPRRVLGQKEDTNHQQSGSEARHRQHHTHSRAKRLATSSMETPPGSIPRRVNKGVERRSQGSRDDNGNNSDDDMVSPSASPLGALRKRKWRLNDFIINPATTGNAQYAYHATIRGKERKCLPGHECSHCAKFYKLTGQSDDTTTRKDIIYSRHRDMFQRPPSPPGFWQSDFPSTQQVLQERNQAEIQRKSLLESRLNEALQGSKGRWMFKDPNLRQLANTSSSSNNS